MQTSDMRKRRAAARFATVRLPVVLPTPDCLRPIWAARTAVMAAIDRPTRSNALPNRWHYVDASGNCLTLRFLATDGRFTRRFL